MMRTTKSKMLNPVPITTKLRPWPDSCTDMHKFGRTASVAVSGGQNRSFFLETTYLSAMQHLLLRATVCLCMLVGLAASCDKGDNPIVDEPDIPDGVRGYTNVDEALWPYFNKFEDEAAARGVRVDLSASQVRARLMEIPENGVAGDCQFDPNDANRLRIDKDTWRRVDEELREYIVFHELGHCVLVRKHREDANAAGICLSMMASGTGVCRDDYKPTTREALLDELFDPVYYGDWQ